MLDGIGIPLLVPSAYGLIALIVLAVLRGYLVPRRVLEDVRQDRDDRVAEARALADAWRQAYEFERDANGQLREHGQLSLDTARTATAVVRAITAPSVEGDPDANAVA